MPIIDPTVALSTRQEAFCRHCTASGNAADAARRAGYAERSARQTGCALLERPWIVENIEQRRRDSLDWLQRAEPLNAPRQPDGPDSGDFTPTMTKHDIS